MLNTGNQCFVPCKGIFFIDVSVFFHRQAAREHAWLFKTRQALAPVALRFFIVLFSKPLDVIGIRLALTVCRCPACSERFIALEQAFHEDAHAPAVHHNMMIAPDKIQLICSKAENRHLEQYVFCQVKALALNVLFVTLNVLLLAVLVCMTDILIMHLCFAFR
ncbi:Uncharacterised protein [Bacillus subtilis]|nr:Uncharacterised protein [Streptococcus pneumoniae]COO31708.1 Uncharacterised protein [Bacillus subtilis]